MCAMLKMWMLSEASKTSKNSNKEINMGLHIGKGNGNLLQYSVSKSHGQRILVKIVHGVTLQLCLSIIDAY